MLFFRSEERVREWCEARGEPVRPLVTIPQLWGMATAWYASRLAADSRRPQPDEIRGILARLGLEGEFWDPRGSGPPTAARSPRRRRRSRRPPS